MTSLFSLEGKVALVTGASRGLGLAMARALAGAGARVVLNGRDQAALERSAAEIRDSGGRAEICVFDVTHRATAVAAMKQLAEQHGRLDILVANAGIQHRRPLLEFETADFERVVNTNLTGVFVLAREAANIMMRQRSGRIIVTGSITAQLARPTISAYIASKGAVTSLTRALAVELAPYGITCNAIAPGFFVTDLNAALIEDSQFDEWLRTRVPAGRWAEPEEIGGPAVFLASDASSFVNGHVLTVDGGMTAAM